MNVVDRLHWIERAATPPALTAIREGLTFGHDHQLSSSRSEWIIGYRHAFRYGLHYLPRGFRLDGLVVDGGANVGDFIATIRRLEPRGKVLAFEPSPSLRKPLADRFADDRGVTLNHSALAETGGWATLHAASLSAYSSLLTPHQHIHVTSDAKVRTVTLDDVVREPVRLLKIDVQGYELPVLRGGRETLAQTDAVLIEVNFAPEYEDSTMFCDVDEFLRHAGFVLSGISEPVRPGERAQSADACYLRSELGGRPTRLAGHRSEMASPMRRRGPCGGSGVVQTTDSG